MDDLIKEFEEKTGCDKEAWGKQRISRNQHVLIRHTLWYFLNKRGMTTYAIYKHFGKKAQWAIAYGIQQTEKRIKEGNPKVLEIIKKLGLPLED